MTTKPPDAGPPLTEMPPAGIEATQHQSLDERIPAIMRALGDTGSRVSNQLVRELEAMTCVSEVLSAIDADARSRVLRWALSRFGCDDR